MTAAAAKKGPFGRPIRDQIAVVDLRHKILALFADHNSIGAAGYIKGKQESASKFGWPDPGLRAVTVAAGFERGQHIPTPCQACGAAAPHLEKPDGGLRGWVVRCDCGAYAWSEEAREDAVLYWNEEQRRGGRR